MDIDEERMRAVNDAVWELLKPRNALLGVPTLDVSKPNVHDSKAEFRRELEAVESAIEALRTVSRALYPEGQDTDEGSAALARRIQEAICRSATRCNASP